MENITKRTVTEIGAEKTCSKAALSMLGAM
jgi:hypothetical protein